MNSLAVGSLTVALLLAPASHALAEPGNPLEDRFSVSLGGFLLDTSTRMRVDGTGTRGTEINLEEDLGFDDTDRFRADAYWRFTPRQKIRLMYFDTRRTESRLIERDITFRDTTFTTQTELRARFETRVAELAYEFAVLRSEHYEVTASLGVHTLKFKTTLSASGAVANAAASETAEADGPLPVFGLRGIYRFNEHLYADLMGQYFQISLDPYDGRISDYNVAVVWQAFPHVGFGIGYNEFETRVDVSGSRFDGRLRWRYGGARLFVTASF